MKKLLALLMLLATVLALSGCVTMTVDRMYALPKRSTKFNDLQTAIDGAMTGLEYSAPASGENQQTVQMADLNGDGEDEYLLFARGSGEKPLKILVFTRSGDNYTHIDTIESLGSAFRQVEYVDMDETPGVELVVGRSVSDQVMGAVAVYTFSEGQAQQLLSVSYSRFVTADLDGNGMGELMVIAQSETEGGNGIAFMYSYDEGTMVRSAEASLSAPPENIKRIMVSGLSGGVPAVYVASAVDESAVITDVLAIRDDLFTNVSFSNESGTSVQTLRNHYVYADDIDEDGELELPSLITMNTGRQRGNSNMQYLIRWYTMGLDGSETDKMYTFHNYDAGWYIRLDSQWAHRILVSQDGSTYTFYLWSDRFTYTRKLLTVYALNGADREEAAVSDGRFILHRGEGVIYCAKLEAAVTDCGITEEKLINHFRLIQLDWKTGET